MSGNDDQLQVPGRPYMDSRAWSEARVISESTPATTHSE